MVLFMFVVVLFVCLVFLMAVNGEGDEDGHSTKRQRTTESARGVYSSSSFTALEASMRCVIANETMAGPVITADGHSYERSAIEKWFGYGNATSPSTGTFLSHLDLVPNFALRSAIHAIFPEARERFEEAVLKERLAALNTPVDHNGRTQLFISSLGNQAARGLELIKDGADVNQAWTDNGETPLLIIAATRR